MNVSNLFAGTALALSALGTHAADLGHIDLSSGSASFANAPITWSGVFLDTFNFTAIEPMSTVTATVTSAQNVYQDLDFYFIDILGPAQSRFNFTQISNDPYELWAIRAVLPTAGNYTLRLYGGNDPFVPGTYAGTIAITPYVPEPGTFALMLAGLGGVGLLARRRTRL
jgi:hypothetical protein